jgi:hypothetical protein
MWSHRMLCSFYKENTGWIENYDYLFANTQRCRVALHRLDEDSKLLRIVFRRCGTSLIKYKYLSAQYRFLVQCGASADTCMLMRRRFEAALSDVETIT